MAKSDNWQTPPALMARLHAEFHFTHEMCAAAGNRALPHLPYYGLDNDKDVLLEAWPENAVCYMNPPYSKLPQMVETAWQWTAISQYLTAILLIPAYTDTGYFQNCIAKHAHQIRFVKGRLRFWENGVPGKDTARFPSAVVVFQKGYSAPETIYWDWKNGTTE